MTGGKSAISLRLALLATCGLIWSGAAAQAADLGGDCCADLEERVAELEATTARKGNRKVSLTISGWVNEAVFFWDDGVEGNVYVGTNSLEQSRVQFSGDAKINGDWSAGYRLELGINGNPSNQFSQAVDNGAAAGTLVTRHSHWYLKSKSYGKLSVGLAGTATYHLLDDADVVNTRNYSDPEAATVALGAFNVRVNSAFVSNGLTNIRWSDIAQGVNNDTPGQNGRRNVVRYDSPEFGGFTLTGSWGEDDMGGIAITYKGEVGDFKMIAKAGYEHNSDSNPAGQGCNAVAKNLDCEWWGAAASIIHTPTGLFLYGAYGEQQDDSEAALDSRVEDQDTTWFIQAGIERKFIPIGKTTIFGEYREDDTGSNLSVLTNVLDANTFIQSGNLEFVAAGVVQNIEAAAMDLYLIYRHSEGEFRDGAGNRFDLDDFDMVISGARIQF